MTQVSVLFNEPKLLKSRGAAPRGAARGTGFSALQRAEIAEIKRRNNAAVVSARVSVLFNEPKLLKCDDYDPRSACGRSFSALQRAEIAEMQRPANFLRDRRVSVLFNEPKLLKSGRLRAAGFSDR